MRKFLPVLLIAFGVLISCKKQQPRQPVNQSAKTVRFILYTNQDFSTDNDTISFALTIRNNTGNINSRTIFDTTLATRRFKDIPKVSDKLVIEKTVPNDGTVLTVGFIYTDKFGVGSHFDTVGINERLKVFEYPFQ